MMLNAPLFDWLTLTTFEEKNANALRYLLIGDDWEPEKRLQYKGLGSGSYFFGDAIQVGKSHYMFQASGESADIASSMAMQNFGPYDFNVTRCDLQITIPLPRCWDSRELYDELTRWDAPGRPRQVSIIQSGDGNDTIYIGSRTSDRFTRIYVKPLDNGLKALRFEVEYKGDHAHRVFNDVRQGSEIKRRTLLGEVQSLPRPEFGVLRHFLRVLGNNPHKPEIKRVTGESASLDWLRQQVTPTLERLCNDHELGLDTRLLVKAWYDAYCNLDNNEI